MNDASLEQYRYFLKDSIRQEVDFALTDQSRRIPPPPVEKPFDPGARRVDLPPRSAWQSVQAVDLQQAIRDRESVRRFADAPLKLDELSFLLWATQGVRERLESGGALRTVPSAGARHALETYVCALQVAGLDAGVYRYLPLEHQLLSLADGTDLRTRLRSATLGQAFAGQGAATFVWAAIPYRMEWRYGLAAHKVIALDAGHVCQNLYLACAAIGAGTCAVAAYDQQAMDRLIAVDGKDEFTVYLAPVGKRQAHAVR